jgi:hypothetical protein
MFTESRDSDNRIRKYIMTIDKKGFSFKMISTLTARIAEVHSHDTEIAIDYLNTSHVAIDACMSKPEFKEIQMRLIKNARISDKATNKNDFVAVKVLVKIMHVLCAVGQGLRAPIDAHTTILMHQLVKLSKLTSKSCMVSQSKGAVYHEFDTVQELDQKHCRNYQLSTAGTQTSSSRMMFNYLNMCDVVKFKKDDVIVIQDNERTKALIALFN